MCKWMRRCACVWGSSVTRCLFLFSFCLFTLTFCSFIHSSMHWSILEEEGHVWMSEDSSVELLLPCNLVVCRNESQVTTAYAQISASTHLVILPVLCLRVWDRPLHWSWFNSSDCIASSGIHLSPWHSPIPMAGVPELPQGTEVKSSCLCSRYSPQVLSLWLCV